MKHRTLIFGFIIFVLALCFFTFLLFKLTFGAETRHTKIIALCFDDGPRPYVLKELLPILEKYGVPGTFFVMGWAVPQNKELVKKMHEAGHEIENHSFGHENLKILYKEKGAEAAKKTIKRCGDVILEAIGRKPKFFRPPYWIITEEIEKIVKAEGYKVMKLENPDINTLDYEDVEKHRSPEILIERVKHLVSSREAKRKSTHVLVFHELPLTVEALKVLIPCFQTQEYKFVRLDEKY